ncbi:hypothetical protein EZV62_004859 [Acer yangbiense]|uniref:ATP-dependent DNA helicase n=1 Tax=Acer yangbiense TaxID=1000413 RepID=A0A5C7IM96_9ROSI|nr:hypothetical protein EZV62_004859 [Acer yangbiense]
MLDQNNVLAQSFRYARDRYKEEDFTGVKMRLIRHRSKDGRTYNLPTASEVAALIVGDIDSSIVSFVIPYGEDGYRDDVKLKLSGSSKDNGRTNVSMREFVSFRLQNRDEESQLLFQSRKLFQQFIVDAYTMIEAERLNFIRFNQPQLRADLYKDVNDALNRGEKEPSATGKRIILPSSFTGGPRYMSENCKDAFGICRWAGYPSLFITITCNPRWPEIMRFVKKRGLKPEDHPDILCRVFKVKLDQLLRDLRKGCIFGRVIGYKPSTASDIDRMISAAIPDEKEDPTLFAAVETYMIHGPCGQANLNSPCMKGGKCSKRFPKKFMTRTRIDEEGFPHYRRRDDGRTVKKKNIELDNRYVVPYNPKLLLKYQAHINVEFTCQTSAIKYLFKYIHKGNDRVTAAFSHSAPDGDKSRTIDEIQKYYDCRYVSACEAAWRIFGFEIHYRYPPVQRLSFHLPQEKTVIFKDGDSIEDILKKADAKKSMFEAWMGANKKYEEARNLTYSEFPMKFVYKEDKQEWTRRKKGFAIGRINHVPSRTGEDFYLRMLINFQKGCTRYEDIRTINGVEYPSFKDACYCLGLLDDDKEYIDGIKEASFWGSGHYIRRLFANLLLSNSMTRPEFVWESCWKLLSDDILHHQKRVTGHQDLIMSDEEIKNNALAEVEKILHGNGRSLRDYATMPFPSGVLLSEVHNKLILDELSYDRASLTELDKKYLSCLTVEQKFFYDEIMSTASENKGGFFFLYGYGGTGKTFIWKTLSAAFRSKGEIVLNVASSGIASLLLPGGRTAHSRLSIPIQINEDSTCNIKQGSPQAELLLKTKLIIWDEAPMVHRFCFEALDRTLKDILKFSNPNSCEEPFGGKIIVLRGDFRQILPVVPYGGRQEIVHATINSSHLWDYCKVLTLTKNMRLQTGSSDQNLNDIREFSEWLLKIGNREVGEDFDGEATIEVPDEMLIKDQENGLAKLVEFVYPNFLENSTDPNFFQERAILSPTFIDVAMLNEYLMPFIPGDERIYLSSDTICKEDANFENEEDTFSPDILNTFTASGLPNHKLNFKVGVPVLLLRNIDQSNGLCNGTRLLITKLGNHVIEAKILSGNNIGQIVLIPRMTMTPSSHTLPVKFKRRQFPLVRVFCHDYK